MILGNFEFFIRVLVAGVLGAIVGLEREKRFKEAGLRTHFLVALGSAVMMIISKYAFNDILHEEGIGLDPSRVAAQIVSGVGFLGAGMILVQRRSIYGLTTAAGIWATAGIGMAIGAGMYALGIFGTILILVGLELLNRIFKFAIPKSYQLSVDCLSTESIKMIIENLTLHKFSIKDYRVRMENLDNTTKYVLELKIQSKTHLEDNQITQLLYKLNGVTAITFQ
ncbi:putative Mg2+ transporter-C (MgtC) family protein [Lederbergia galactosidilyticus]|uniref:Methyltransferase n=1 Tax=Lederbergia galactosidilytica TaxID=217031 RepID=A0A0Q9XUE2_9BACI|nr:MgtC/SapB family protein [Lederbergia galactosidilytica]KRG11910.1 methyltransferase [Lederbergia galactosidilytica]MBP1913849.1 putative Mg2+ transporter-C (MgtC) family protein [Lederbergia galactosidilytica]